MSKILIVDDSSTARSVARDALSGFGFEVIEAENGVEALRLVDDEVACILCDINMPVMNGLEFLESLQGTGRPVPPVLVVSTESEAKLVRQARALGAVGWMVKPMRRELLGPTIERLLERQRKGA